MSNSNTSAPSLNAPTQEQPAPRPRTYTPPSIEARRKGGTNAAAQNLRDARGRFAGKGKNLQAAA